METPKKKITFFSSEVRRREAVAAAAESSGSGTTAPRAAPISFIMTNLGAAGPAPPPLTTSPGSSPAIAAPVAATGPSSPPKPLKRVREAPTSPVLKHAVPTTTTVSSPSLPALSRTGTVDKGGHVRSSITFHPPASPAFSSALAPPAGSNTIDTSAHLRETPTAPSNPPASAPTSVIPVAPPLSTLPKSPASALASAILLPAPLFYYTPVTVEATPSYGADRFLQIIANDHPEAWATIVGLFFQDSERAPTDVGAEFAPQLNNGWVRDLRKQDLMDKNPGLKSERWLEPTHEPDFVQLVAYIRNGRQLAFEATIRWWANKVQPDIVTRVLEKAGWTWEGVYLLLEWFVMDDILKMEEGLEKDLKTAQAKEESPRVFEFCVNHRFCGIRRFKRKSTQDHGYDPDEPDYIYDSEYEVSLYRIIGREGREELPTSPPKRRRMSGVNGRPTQFHAVPADERAVDSSGKQLPWALEWHEDHPNARGQKRHPEEKGPFGKSTRRKGTSRTRTATPAKKENPTLEGFEQALKYDAKKAAEVQHEVPASARSQNDGNVASQNAPSHNKEPTQVMIYGYSPSTQWAAIGLYEKISHGLICESYEREPPAELRKYPNTFSSSPSVHRRPLTKQEKSMAFKYAGGESWVKVTFDSAEAADRACELSPSEIYGHWVYAEPYRGIGPESDQPIPIREGDMRSRAKRGSRASSKPSQTLGAAFSQHAAHQHRATSTLPRSFNTNAVSQADQDRPVDAGSLSPSTVSSGTVTGPEHPNLRNRHPSPTEGNRSSSTTQTPGQAPDNQMMRYFPERPRYVLRPAHEALLPQPTFWDRQYEWLRHKGLVPRDPIGQELPVMENGEFDWANATYYWRFFYWLDTTFGSNWCGLRDE